MTAYPLTLTVEHEDGDWSEDYGRQPEYGFIVIRLNGHEVKKFELQHHVYPGDREALEQCAADRLAGELAHHRVNRRLPLNVLTSVITPNQTRRRGHENQQETTQNDHRGGSSHGDARGGHGHGAGGTQ